LLNTFRVIDDCYAALWINYGYVSTATTRVYHILESRLPNWENQPSTSARKEHFALESTILVMSTHLATGWNQYTAMPGWLHGRRLFRPVDATDIRA
jgi:hypothetical protein